jgi:hypothetical protein
MFINDSIIYLISFIYNRLIDLKRIIIFRIRCQLMFFPQGLFHN